MPSSRSKKRVKTEDDDTDITTSAQPSDHVLRTVEFKFCSLKTAILPHDGAMTGTLHIPMLQNTKTGRYKVPSGKTEFTGKAKFCDIEFADPDYDVHADVTERKDSCRTGIINKNELEEDFTGSFGRKDADSPIDEFRLGYHLQINTVSDDVAAALIRSDRPMCPRMGESDIRPIGMTREYFPFVEYPSERHLEVGSILRHLDDWEKNAGGYLCVYASAKANPDCMSWQSCDIDEQLRLRHSNTWRADYKIKMYTVLSENSPSDATEIAQVDDGESSGWDVDALVHLMKARFPELGEDWAKRAVKNYRYFIDLKVKSKDWDSKVYSPSKAIDEVWHAHLSFPQQYRQDMMAYCGHVIKHSPVLGNLAQERYEAAYYQHVRSMEILHDDSVRKKSEAAYNQRLRKLQKELQRDRGSDHEDDQDDEDCTRDIWAAYYDEDFWPKPKKVHAEYTIAHDGDSDDGVAVRGGRKWGVGAGYASYSQCA